MSLAPLSWLADKLLSAWESRRHVRVLVHRAYLGGNPDPCWFVNVTNLSAKREVEVTNVWFEANPRVPVVRPERPTPKRLKPDETWETWIAATALDSLPDVERSARVRLSTGKVVKSRANKNVGPAGYVAGP
jgi:hypothetical protein